jgi:hypothetical protein
MKPTNEARTRRSPLRRWALPASLALAVVLLPGASSPAEARSDKKQRSEDRWDRGDRDHRHDRDRDRHYRSDRRHRDRYDHRDGYYRAHRHGHRPHYAEYRPGRRHGHYKHHRHFRPVRVHYHRRHYRAPRYFRLETPYVVVHGPRFGARLVYYPAGAPLYEPGYCPSAVHYHPYDYDYFSDPGIHGRVSIRIGANF